MNAFESRPSASPALGGGMDKDLADFLAKHSKFSAMHAHPDLGTKNMKIVDGLPGIKFKKRRGSGISKHSAMT